MRATKVLAGLSGSRYLFAMITDQAIALREKLMSDSQARVEAMRQSILALPEVDAPSDEVAGRSAPSLDGGAQANVTNAQINADAPSPTR